MTRFNLNDPALPKRPINLRQYRTSIVYPENDPLEPMNFQQWAVERLSSKYHKSVGFRDLTSIYFCFDVTANPPVPYFPWGYLSFESDLHKGGIVFEIPGVKKLTSGHAPSQIGHCSMSAHVFATEYALGYRILGVCFYRRVS